MGSRVEIMKKSPENRVDYMRKLSASFSVQIVKTSDTRRFDGKSNDPSTTREEVRSSIVDWELRYCIDPDPSTASLENHARTHSSLICMIAYNYL